MLEPSSRLMNFEPPIRAKKGRNKMKMELNTYEVYALRRSVSTRLASLEDRDLENTEEYYTLTNLYQMLMDESKSWYTVCVNDGDPFQYRTMTKVVNGRCITCRFDTEEDAKTALDSYIADNGGTGYVVKTRA